MISLASLATIAVTLIGRPVPATCYPLAQYNTVVGDPAGTLWVYGAAGFYSWRDDRIGLLQSMCRQLARIPDRSGLTIEEAMAVFAYAHELGHASGLVDEHQADCYAAAHVSQVAWLLGLRRRSDFLELADFVHWYGGYDPGSLPQSCPLTKVRSG